MNLIVEIIQCSETLPENSDCRDYDRKVTKTAFSIESSSTIANFPIGTLMEQIKLIVVEN